MKPSRSLVLASALGLALIGAAVAGVVAHAGPATKSVSVTEKEFHISLSTAKVPAGHVRFTVRNTGHFAHALEIAGPGVKAKTPLIRPGTSATLSVTLGSGTYSLWCPVPGHAAQGMKTSLAAGAASAPASTSNTSTDSGGGGGAAWG